MGCKKELKSLGKELMIDKAIRTMFNSQSPLSITQQAACQAIHTSQKKVKIGLWASRRRTLLL